MTGTSKAHEWCRAHGLHDGQEWRSLEAAIRREVDCNASEVHPCRWALIGPEGAREEHPGIVWLSDYSGVLMTESWWDVIADGTTPAVWPDGRVEGPI